MKSYPVLKMAEALRNQKIVEDRSPYIDEGEIRYVKEREHM